jgi:hypothetical protein
VRLHLVALGAVLVCGSPIVLGACGGGGQSAATTTVAPPRPKTRPLPPNTIRVHWHKDALVPAPRSGRVCIVTYKTGRVCAAYRVAQIPAVMLKNKLALKGFHVRDVP